jgi:hypothetical protein
LPCACGVYWRPACNAFALLVEEAGGLDVWLVQASAAGIAPGIRYGVVPAASIEQERAMPLRTGVRYVVALFKGASLDELTLIGQASFTP